MYERKGKESGKLFAQFELMTFYLSKYSIGMLELGAEWKLKRRNVYLPLWGKYYIITEVHDNSDISIRKGRNVSYD